jgi:hypothetical protein
VKRFLCSIFGAISKLWVSINPPPQKNEEKETSKEQYDFWKEVQKK